jgi:hypothetical protein
MKILFFLVVFVIGNLNCALAGRHHHGNAHAEQWQSPKGKLKSYERRRQHQYWGTIEEFTQKQQAKAPTQIQFHPHLSVEDPKYQIFMIMLLMSTYALQVNAADHKPILSNSNFPNSSELQEHQWVRNATMPVCSINEAFTSQHLSEKPLDASRDAQVGVLTETLKIPNPKVLAKQSTKNSNKKRARTRLPAASVGLESNSRNDGSPKYHASPKNDGIQIIHEFAHNQTCPAPQVLAHLLQVDCTDPNISFDSGSHKQKQCLVNAPLLTKAGLIFAKDVLESQYESRIIQKDLGIIVGEAHDNFYQFLYELLIIKFSAALGAKNLVLEITPQDFAFLENARLLDPLSPFTVTSDIWQYNIRKIRLALSLGMRVIPADLPMPDLTATLGLLMREKNRDALYYNCEYEKLVFSEREPFFCKGMVQAEGSFVAIFGAQHLSFIEPGCLLENKILYYIQLARKARYTVMAPSSNCPDSIIERIDRVFDFLYSDRYRELPIQEIILNSRNS